MEGTLDLGAITQRKVLEMLCTTEASSHGYAFLLSNISLVYKV